MSHSDDVRPSCPTIELFLNRHPCTLKQVLQNHLICFGKVKQPGSAHCACQWWHKRSELSSLPARSKHYPSWEQLTVKVALLCDDPRAKASVLDLHSLLGMLWIWAPWMAESWRGCIRHSYSLCSQLGRKVVQISDWQVFLSHCLQEIIADSKRRDRGEYIPI